MHSPLKTPVCNDHADECCTHTCCSTTAVQACVQNDALQLQTQWTRSVILLCIHIRCIDVAGFCSSFAVNGIQIQFLTLLRVALTWLLLDTRVCVARSIYLLMALRNADRWPSVCIGISCSKHQHNSSTTCPSDKKTSHLSWMLQDWVPYCHAHAYSIHTCINSYHHVSTVTWWLVSLLISESSKSDSLHTKQVAASQLPESDPKPWKISGIQ